MLNFYRRFLPHCAELLKPLNNLLSGKNKRSRLIQWSSEAEKAFESSKCAIADSEMLTYPVRGAVTSICTDASSVAVGAVLQQLVDRIERPLLCLTLNAAITPLTVNSYLSILPCVIFVTFWKVVSVQSSLIINPWFLYFKTL